MSTKFYIYNELDNSALTASSENALFPLSNLLDHRRTKTFRTTANNDFIVLDLGSNRPLDSFVIVDSPNNGFGISSLLLQANPTNNWTSPLLQTSVTLDSTNGIGIAEFASVSCRYVRLVITSTQDYCEISNFFIGSRIEFVDFDLSYPLEFTWNNLATITKNRYGQKFIDEVATQINVNGSFENMNQSEMDEVSNFIAYVSNTIPFYVQFENLQALTATNKINGMYYLAREPKFKLSRGNFWSCDISLEGAM